MHVVVSGGTGFIGSHLVKHLVGRGHSVTVISRSPAKVAGMFDGKAAGCTLETLPAAFDGVVNLAGATLDRRWNAAWKQEIVDSRVEVTRSLCEAATARGAKSFVSGSAIGYYGDRGDEPCTEETAPGDDFLAELCVKWEAAAQCEGLSVATVRTGLVLHRSGGALAVMLPYFKWLLGGRLGSGRQYWSWVHLDDIVALFTFALEKQLSGPLNGAAPNPVTNREFTRALARAVHRPVSLPVPEFALRLLYGEMADMLLLGQKVLPERTQSLGFEFKYTQLDKALHAALYE
ncbi:MAG: TIGR01777 family protein [Planctomycetes bacterium]|nr:TIGR01777 family protein [Planctomycetota bacterium]MCB9934119.1 TIGR01777 family protein [Planctomycetota bacterium]